MFRPHVYYNILCIAFQIQNRCTDLIISAQTTIRDVVTLSKEPAVFLYQGHVHDVILIFRGYEALFAMLHFCEACEVNNLEKEHKQKNYLWTGLIENVYNLFVNLRKCINNLFFSLLK